MDTLKHRCEQRRDNKKRAALIKSKWIYALLNNVHDFNDIEFNHMILELINRIYDIALSYKTQIGLAAIMYRRRQRMKKIYNYLIGKNKENYFSFCSDKLKAMNKKCYDSLTWIYFNSVNEYENHLQSRSQIINFKPTKNNNGIKNSILDSL